MVTTLKFNLCMIETWTFRCQSIYLANYLGISYLIGNLISINSIQNHTATIIATGGGGILWFYNPFNSICYIGLELYVYRLVWFDLEFYSPVNMYSFADVDGLSFMSLVTVFKSYWDNGRVIMN